LAWLKVLTNLKLFKINTGIQLMFNL